jgi:hypothetical protein
VSWEFVRDCVIKVGAFAAICQGWLWLFGLGEQIHRLLVEHWFLTLLAVAAWCVWNHYVHFGPAEREADEYENALRKMQGPIR